MIKKKIFFISRPLDGIYKAIGLGCKKHVESLTKLEFKIKFYKKKTTSFNFLIFFLKNIINLNFLNKKRYLNLTYRNCDIGRHAAAITYRDLFTYNSIFHEIFNLIKYLFLAGVNVDHAYAIVDDIKAAYIDHCGYLNGVYFRVFALKKKIIYTNNNPRGLFCIDFSKKENKKLNKNENAIRIFKKKITNNFTNNKKKFFSILKNPKLIPHMKTTKYRNVGFLKSELKKYNYVIYCHSFVDGSLWFGNDSFSNLRDWLEFTLKELKKNNSRVIIKAHPNFYRKMYSEIGKKDQKIFNQITNKYKSENFLIIDKSISNYKFMKKLSKKTILISHHGTSLLEGEMMGFKTICSTATIWNPHFNVSNQWRNSEDYSKVLKKRWEELDFSNNKDLNNILHQYTNNKYTSIGNYHFMKIVCRHLRFKNFKGYEKEINNLINNTSQNSINRLASKLSANIEKINL
jgi:hypothetical protein